MRGQGWEGFYPPPTKQQSQTPFGIGLFFLNFKHLQRQNIVDPINGDILL